LQGRGTSEAGGGVFFVSIGRARELRKAMTPPERRLWNVLKQRPDGFKFRKQHEHGPYYLDFFCFEAAVAIEVDGLAHELGTNPQRDERRDAWLASRGIRTIRVRATDVRDNLEGVVTYIVEECRERTPRSSPPLDFEGRGTSEAGGGVS
jgi:very-short-patch-repair endonuclease